MDFLTVTMGGQLNVELKFVYTICYLYSNLYQHPLSFASLEFTIDNEVEDICQMISNIMEDNANKYI